MRRSLRTRLLIISALMMLATAGAVVFVAGLTATAMLQRYVERRISVRNERIQSLLTDYYAERDSWAGAPEYLARLEELGGDRVVLAAPNGTVLADSRGELVAGGRLEATWPQPTTTLTVDGRVVGLVYVQTGSHAMLEGERLPFVLGPALPLGAFGAAVAATLLTLALSDRILRPIQSLTHAARRMEAGDLDQRVEATSTDEVGTLAHAFNAMAAGLSRQEDLRRSMVSDIAHELRSPLTNIQGYLEAAQDGVVPIDQTLIANLHEEALLLSRLVRDLQDLALADAGQLSLQRSRVNLVELASDAVTAVQPQASAKRVSVALDAPSALPPADADAQRVTQVLRNLLNNALAATADGDSITVSLGLEGEALRVTVRDTGCGIPSESLPHVFDRFYRVDRARARATGGSGLGLAIVKQWVEAHGGRVWAESAEGEGSTFAFTLPLASRPQRPG